MKHCLIQSGKPVGILKTHKDAPRVLISVIRNSFLNGQPGNILMNWKKKD